MKGSTIFTQSYPKTNFPFLLISLVSRTLPSFLSRRNEISQQSSISRPDSTTEEAIVRNNLPPTEIRSECVEKVIQPPNAAVLANAPRSKPSLPRIIRRPPAILYFTGVNSGVGRPFW